MPFTEFQNFFLVKLLKFMIFKLKHKCKRLRRSKTTIYIKTNKQSYTIQDEKKVQRQMLLKILNWFILKGHLFFYSKNNNQNIFFLPNKLYFYAR